MFAKNNTLDDAILTQKKIILRTDYNVPMFNNKIQSFKRINESINTIKYILNQNPKQLIIISHLGRPNGYDKDLSLNPIREYLQTVLKEKIILTMLEDVDKTCNKDNKIIMLENIRFYKEETKMLNTTLTFRQKLTNLGEVYINDAFGCCHRYHSSLIGIDVSEKYLGFLAQKEINYLSKSLFVNGVKTLILGGSKIIDKIGVIKNLIPKMDNILIGGGMAFTFMKYRGMKIGKSLFDEESFKLVPEIMNLANEYNTNIVLPLDFNCNDRFDNTGDIVYFCNNIPDSHMGLDIGPLSIITFINVLKNSDLVIWNGPLGVFEFDNFDIGSRKIMECMSKIEATTIIGGGDTTRCCEKFNLQDKMTHVSTGGGASLELLEGKDLPGIKFVTQ